MVLQSHESALQGSGVAELCDRTLDDDRSNMLIVRQKRAGTPPVASGAKGRKIGSLHQHKAQCMRTPGCLRSLRHAGACKTAPGPPGLLPNIPPAPSLSLPCSLPPSAPGPSGIPNISPPPSLPLPCSANEPAGDRSGPAPEARCQHGREKRRCKECGGSGLCQHGKEKRWCKECGGSGLCQHGKRKAQCKECGGSDLCHHGKLRAQCKECGGSAFCQHGKRKALCKECGGSGLCQHGKQKAQCKECGPPLKKKAARKKAAHKKAAPKKAAKRPPESAAEPAKPAKSAKKSPSLLPFL